MTFWPEDYSGAWTLAGQAKRSGVGLHSGHFSEVQLKGCVNPGFFLRVEGHHKAFRLAPHQVRDSQLCTTLDLGPCKVATVEHFCLLYTSPSPRDRTRSRMPSSA